MSKIPSRVQSHGISSGYVAKIYKQYGNDSILLQRNLLSRGRILVVLVGTRKAVAIVVKNNKTEKRYTLLKDRLLES